MGRLGEVNGERLLIVTLAQFSDGWTVFGGFRDGMAVYHRFPMRRIGVTPEGNIVVVDEQIPESHE